jgi:hypothetical protein
VYINCEENLTKILIAGVNVGEVCSEKVLNSQNATLVPQLIPSKSDSKNDQGHTEEQHPHKV